MTLFQTCQSTLFAQRTKIRNAFTFLRRIVSLCRVTNIYGLTGSSEELTRLQIKTQQKRHFTISNLP